MEFCKQEMELFNPFPGRRWKSFFFKMFHIFTEEFYIDFWNRKWNCQNRKWNYLSPFKAYDKKTSLTKCFLFWPMKQEIELFLHFQALDKKNLLSKCFSILSKSSEFILNTRNGYYFAFHFPKFFQIIMVQNLLYVA